MNNSRSGFTLLEVLVVIMIIVLLASFLLPAVQRARRKASQNNCLNNIKQLGITLHIYSIDNQEKFPSGETEGKISLQLLKNGYLISPKVYVCPAGDGIESSNHGRENTDYFYADELTERSPGYVPLIIDDAPNHDAPNSYNVVFLDGHAEGVSTAPSGSPGMLPTD